MFTQKPGSVLENETHNILWDFQLLTNHPVTARRPVLVLIKMKKIISTQVVFTAPADLWVKVKEDKNLDKYLDFTGGLKKLKNMKVTVIPIIGFLKRSVRTWKRGLMSRRSEK